MDGFGGVGEDGCLADAEGLEGFDVGEGMVDGFLRSGFGLLGAEAGCKDST